MCRKIPLPVHDVNGIIKPKRMTLLLGPPSSWKNNIAFGFGWKTWVGFEGLNRMLSEESTFIGADCYLDTKSLAYSVCGKEEMLC
ncbi:hypothetical protein L1987_45769 [Smallanthus sonchifolius]|uniref:Uncharacterized protein n=1 Tax=Smallanthus sonchifolius TaxID=185202 RepID=A0ACB9FXN3_9ASTR|nr:hypothetical protein L1987_45769 [Smallanthus sonchifolius]